MNEIINDKQLVYSVYKSDCSECAHFNIDSFNCKAFKDGIPDSILEGKIKHDKPLQGQKNNITFKQK